jgi:hypothetical protein
MQRETWCRNTCDLLTSGWGRCRALSEPLCHLGLQECDGDEGVSNTRRNKREGPCQKGSFVARPFSPWTPAEQSSWQPQATGDATLDSTRIIRQNGIKNFSFLPRG